MPAISVINIQDRSYDLQTLESLTAGTVAAYLMIKGFSIDSIIAYSDSAKKDLLHVPEHILKRGTVSKSVAGWMLPDFMSMTEAISTTGFAGRIDEKFGIKEKDDKLAFIAALTSRKGYADSNIEMVEANKPSRRANQKYIAALAIRNYGWLSGNLELIGFNPTRSLINDLSSKALRELYAACDDKMSIAVYEEGNICVLQPAIASVPISGFYFGGRMRTSRPVYLTADTDDVAIQRAIEEAVTIRKEFNSSIGISVIYDHRIMAVSYTQKGVMQDTVRFIRLKCREYSDIPYHAQYAAIKFLIQTARIAEPFRTIHDVSLPEKRELPGLIMSLPYITK
ncbi:MAG: CinA family protein [Candidatus Woesearchaeota archaeon]|nr:CinA family protein [Candidatus Woesearchaeota archaeon]